MRHADTVQPNGHDQIGDSNEPRPHVRRQRLQFRIHGRVQGFNAPRHI
jgi:hypothetical protein